MTGDRSHPMTTPRITLGRRRFTCLSPTLVRLEFAPDGVFGDRRSLVAAAPQKPLPFRAVREEDGWTVLETGALTVRTRQNDDAFARTNVEVRWSDGRLLQYWRPGDRDHRNLGGTVRSLDRYGRTSRMDGVHPADMESPDTKALTWLAWLQCEDDPPFYAASPAKGEPGLNAGDWHRFAAERDHQGRILERTLNQTLDAHRWSPGPLSESGYFLLNDSDSAVLDAEDFPVERRRPGGQDWYFFAYGRDYRQALRDFIRLTGPAPLPTRHSFGLIFSRWPAWKEADAKTLVKTFTDRGYPLSVLVLDMEWHQEGWGNWDWNPEMYADPAAFFRWAHRRGIQVTLNDHPLDVREDDSHFEPYLRAAGTDARVRAREYNRKTVRMIDVDICTKREARAFLDVCHRPIVRQGLDFWWNDGCRGEMAGATGQLVCNKLMFEDVRSPHKRGMLLARYGGLGSHRYGVFFTGDTESCWPVLALQCEFNIRAGHLGLAYVSHDIGGFYTPQKTDKIDRELYLRWLQFGVFSPILRFHSAPGSGSRQPWDYDDAEGRAARRWLELRNSLLPYLYTAAREHHETGVPLVRGLFLDLPADRAAYRYDQYLFGPALLVAPVLGPERRRTVYLPPGEWFEFESSRRLPGGLEITRPVALEDTPVYVRAGSIIPRQSPAAPLHAPHVRELTLDLYAGAEGTADLYEDDGLSPAYETGAFCRTRFTLAARGRTLILRGTVSEGAPLGGERQLTLRLFGVDSLSRVLVNGRRLPAAAISGDAASGLVVQAGTLAAPRPFEIRLCT